MKEFIEHSIPLKKGELSYKPEHKKIANYEKNENSNIWIVDLIITDNEAVSVQTHYNRKGWMLNNISKFIGK